MIVHKLKIEPNYLSHLEFEEKKAEIRYNDRDYQKGDVLKFYNNTRDTSVGDADFYLYFKITHIHSGLGLADGYICLSLLRTDKPK